MKKFNFLHYVYLIVLQLCLLANAQAQNQIETQKKAFSLDKQTLHSSANLQIQNMFSDTQYSDCFDPYFPNFVTKEEKEVINLLWLKNIKEPEFCELQKNTIFFTKIIENFSRAALLNRNCPRELYQLHSEDYHFRSNFRQAIFNIINYSLDPKMIIKTEIKDSNNNKISKLLLDLNKKSEWQYQYKVFLYYMKIMNKDEMKLFKAFLNQSDVQVALKNYKFINYINKLMENNMDYRKGVQIGTSVIFVKEYLIKTKKLNWFIESLDQINPELNKSFLKIKPFNENTDNDKLEYYKYRPSIDY